MRPAVRRPGARTARDTARRRPSRRCRRLRGSGEDDLRRTPVPSRARCTGCPHRRLRLLRRADAVVAPDAAGARRTVATRRAGVVPPLRLGAPTTAHDPDTEYVEIELSAPR